MKGLGKALLIFGLILIVGFLCTSKETSAKTCIKSGCNRKCAQGCSYCYFHKPHTAVKKNKRWETDKSKAGSSVKGSSGYSNTNKVKRNTKKSYYTDEMPDCDDYEDWGDFMDDWDGNMPDGSDASDYWDNW